MKDNRLEKEFEDYFKGVNIKNDITADAKKAMAEKPKRRIWPQIAKYASIAASIVLVFSLALTITLKTDFNRLFNFGGSGVNKPDAAAQFQTYTDSDLQKQDLNAYSLASLNSSLKLIEDFAHAKNASVTSCEAAYTVDKKLALVIAEVHLLNGLNRDETSIFIEFTDQKAVYSELTGYYDGKENTYKGAEYYLTATTAQNGEPEFRLHISYGGVKYYFKVQSTDRKAYEKYLKMVTGK